MSISSNLTEREGKKERKRRIERERENGGAWGFGVFSFLVGMLQPETGKKKKKKKRNKRRRKRLYRSKQVYRCLNFKRIYKVTYLTFNQT